MGKKGKRSRRGGPTGAAQRRDLRDERATGLNLAQQYLSLDDDTSKHNLTLDGYRADDRWVLLEPTA